MARLEDQGLKHRRRYGSGSNAAFRTQCGMPNSTEPVNVLSSYKFQDGLAYYESTKDTASHFFIDYLPKGNYVFKYSTRIVHKGRYQTGFAGIQCMYAPEFNSHSESIWVVAE